MTRMSSWARGCHCCSADETLPWARAIAVLPDQVYVPLLDLGRWQHGLRRSAHD